MASIYLRQISILFKRLLICYLIYFFCRVLFFFANKEFFPETGISGLLNNCFYGLRFDTFSIVISNSLFIILSLLPFNFFEKKTYQRLLLWIFVICNTVFTAANCIDVAYFPFIRKRSSADLFAQMGGQSDLLQLAPQFLRDFWWALLFFVAMIWFMAFLFKRVNTQLKGKYTTSSPGQWVLIVLLFLLCAGFSVLGARGGLQRVPIDIVNAGAVTEPSETPIVLNTPFTLIKSVSQKAVEEFHWYTEDELKKIYSPVHKFDHTGLQKKNVVVLILESFSKEYTKLSHGKSVTPFLDSLMDKSLVFSNAFSNGSKSIEGIPSILSSLPSLMENPFINSIYANNGQTSFATLLRKEGYQTAFFHGGINGTMNFDDWAPSAGYKDYYGKNEYKNDEDFDNFWGIWDEPFLQYSVRKMDEMKQPFHTAIFTLSSHHPYFVPDRYKNVFPTGPLENSQSVRYADYALRQFFNSAKKTSWYNNTLFIITADHASISEHKFYKTIAGSQCIPILFFNPDNSLAEVNNTVFTQIDILPSALDLLGYNKPFFSFGKSFRSTANPTALIYYGGNYHLFNDSLIYFINNNELNRAYNYRRDSVLYFNLLRQQPRLDSSVLGSYKAFLQTYNETLIKNNGVVK